MIEHICALEKLKTLEDNSQDIVFGDFPYALGSSIYIDTKDGKPKYKDAKDFQNKWDMPDHNFWEKFFKECMRVLKYGGRVLAFGIDRQLMLFNYYAVAAGLEIQQSLYWYFIQNFPKSVDLSKQIDKKQGNKREVVGQVERWGSNASGGRGSQKNNDYNPTKVGSKKIDDVTIPGSELAKEYEGYKYSIAPLKQSLETIMVFQKPTKTSSVIDDFIQFKNGDNEISPSIWDIDRNRIQAEDKEYEKNFKLNYDINSFNTLNLNIKKSTSVPNKNGRYPSQVFCCNSSAEKLDMQSGILKSGAMKKGTLRKNEFTNTFNVVAPHTTQKEVKASEGGCSKILHKITLLDEELDLLTYNAKVSDYERYVGCDTNNHPTLKPIQLIKKIALLLKTPHVQSIVFPFAGAGSDIIGFAQAGYDTSLFTATEINKESVNIGNKRISFWKNHNIEEISKLKKTVKIKKNTTNNITNKETTLLDLMC